MRSGEPRPRWLRPAAAIAAIAVHLAVLAAFRPAEGVSLAGPVEIDLVSDPGLEDRPTPESLPTPEARFDPTPPDPEPDPVRDDPPPADPPPETPPVDPPPPPSAWLDAPPAEAAMPVPRPAETPDPVRIERPTKTQAAARERRRRETPRRPPAAPVDSTRSAAARAEAAASRRAAVASYAGQVSEQLRRHRHYPAAAREAGLAGTVVVAFVVGPGGRVATHTIVRSSGHPILDRAVSAMMAAIALPPPPGGLFRSTVPVRFDLTR